MLTDSTLSVSSDVAEPTFRSMLRCFGMIRRVMHPYFEQYGISASQWGVLRALYRSERDGVEGLRLGDLGNRLLVRPPSVTGVVSRLERQGLVTRRASAQDQRVKLVRLTAEGHALIGRVLQGHAAQVELLLGGLNTSQQEQLRNLMDQLSEHLGTVVGVDDTAHQRNETKEQA